MDYYYYCIPLPACLPDQQIIKPGLLLFLFSIEMDLDQLANTFKFKALKTNKRERMLYLALPSSKFEEM